MNNCPQADPAYISTLQAQASLEPYSPTLDISSFSWWICLCYFLWKMNTAPQQHLMTLKSIRVAKSSSLCPCIMTALNYVVPCNVFHPVNVQLFSTAFSPPLAPGLIESTPSTPGTEYKIVNFLLDRSVLTTAPGIHWFIFTLPVWDEIIIPILQLENWNRN